MLSWKPPGGLACGSFGLSRGSVMNPGCLAQAKPLFVSGGVEKKPTQLNSLSLSTTPTLAQQSSLTQTPF